MKRILLVEDMKFFRETIKFLAETISNTDIVEADSIRKGEELFEPNKFSAVIMGGKDLDGEIGLEFIKKIRPIFKGKLIAMSGSSETQNLLMAAGCEVSLPKEILTIDILTEVIRNLKDIP